ncbi:hypothetical protein REMIM1_PF00356 (plasmid) [Rhizobium etli bv. mimosae str. Mim1]|nr:hypothetical protein REMIM1_PF00356 [Rhizobium etli bv. mimosae str. Mim1]
MPVTARRNFVGELRTSRAKFTISAVVQMIVQEQEAVFADQQPRFEIISLRTKTKEVTQPAHGIPFNYAARGISPCADINL